MNRQLIRTRKRIDAEIEALKLSVALDIKDTIERMGMNQARAADYTGEPQSQLSLMCSGKLRGFSLERLIRARALLDARVSLTIETIEESEKPQVDAAV